MAEPVVPPTLAQTKRLPPLLRRAWYGLNQAFRQRTSHLRITPDQFSILRWLSEGDPAGLTQRELTRLMASDPNTIASTLARMEKLGWVKRQPHERDKRANRVQLLSAGTELFAQAREIALELQHTVMGSLAPERRDQFLADLEQVAEACSAALLEVKVR